MFIFIRENLSGFGICNPVGDSDDEDVHIFKPGRRFSAVFNTFVN